MTDSRYFCVMLVFFFVLSVGRRSDRARKRRPVKIVSFDTDDSSTNSAPASSVVSPTVRTPAVHVHDVAVSAEKLMSSHDLDEAAVDVVNTDLTSSCLSHSEASDVGSLPGDVDEPPVSPTVHVDVSTDGPTSPKHCASKAESEFSIYRNSSLPNMGTDFGTNCSEDPTNLSSRDTNEQLTHSSSSTVKPDDAEGPLDILPMDNTWFDALRERSSNTQSADAESIASSASVESSSSVNNHTRLVSVRLVRAGFVVLTFFNRFNRNDVSRC